MKSVEILLDSMVVSLEEMESLFWPTAFLEAYMSGPLQR